MAQQSLVFASLHGPKPVRSTLPSGVELPKPPEQTSSPLSGRFIAACSSGFVLLWSQRRRRALQDRTRLAAAGFNENDVKKWDEEVARKKKEKEREEREEEESVERATDPKRPRDAALSRMLTWAQSQASLKVHPGILVKDGQYCASLPIEQGTPLIGVMQVAFLRAEDGSDEAAKDKETAALELAWRMLLEGAGVSAGESVLRILKPWPDAYLNSQPVRSSLPLLWSEHHLDELQDKTLAHAALQQKQRAESFLLAKMQLDAENEKSVKMLPLFLNMFATALSRALEIGPGQWVLAPILDTIPPAGLDGVDGVLLDGNCSLSLEDLGPDGSLLMLCTTKNVAMGEPLCQVSNLAADQLLLQHGIASIDAATFPAKALLDEGSWDAWKLQAILRLVPGALPGRLQGDVLVCGSVCSPRKCNSDGEELTLSEAVGKELLWTAMILSAEEQDAESLEEELRTPLESVWGARRIDCLSALLKILRSCRAELATSEEEDAKCLKSAKGCVSIAVTFRLARKGALTDLIDQLEAASQEAKSMKGLPFAVMGGQPE